MTPIGKWFNRPRRNSSPTRAALTEYMNISSSQQRNNTFPPSNNNTTMPQRAPMLITSSFYNQEYPFEIYDSSAAEEEEQAVAIKEPITPVEPTIMYDKQNFVQEPSNYVSTQQNINMPPHHHHHHDEIYYTREPYRSTNERTPTPFTSSERYTDITDLAEFEKLQNDFKKLEKKHKKKEKKIQELKYLLYSKNMETQPVPVPKPNHGYRSFDSNTSRPPVTPNNQYTRSFDIPRNNKPTSAPKLTNSYQSYYKPYYGYGQDYYYTNDTPSSYYYPSDSLETSSRHTSSTQRRYNSFDNGPEENDDAMLRNYYLHYYHKRWPTT
ncbi:hypothetical protein INT48_003078 [Thamnidium elegans]|uniref:Uncharacterized protein n=1 Tax=Thamnidium elegans TaxID=101142 RepID=A0A8H7SW15_9FUNG|nr:hypothetical protein INT48_003078 [Thamnidium elegans]